MLEPSFVPTQPPFARIQDHCNVQEGAWVRGLANQAHVTVTLAGRQLIAAIP
jgi:hypothetical protein